MTHVVLQQENHIDLALLNASLLQLMKFVNKLKGTKTNTTDMVVVEMAIACHPRQCQIVVVKESPSNRFVSRGAGFVVESPPSRLDLRGAGFVKESPSSRLDSQLNQIGIPNLFFFK